MPAATARAHEREIMSFDPVKFGALEADIRNIQTTILRHSGHIGDLLTHKNVGGEALSNLDERLEAVEKEVSNMSKIIEQAKGAGWAFKAIFALISLIGISQSFIIFKLMVGGVKVYAGQ